MEKSNRKQPNRKNKDLEVNKNTTVFLNLKENIKLNSKRERSVRTRFQRNKRKDSLKRIDQFISINTSSIISIILAIVTKHYL
jgi:hypothetical protein